MDEPNEQPKAPPKAFTDEGEPTGVTLVEDVRIAKTFGPYRILRHLAGGGVGVVYEAEDPALDKLVAVKFLPEIVRRVPDGSDGLFADARAASALGHPNSARVYDVGRSGGACWIGMDLLQPRSAAAYLRAHGRLAWTEATAVAVACSGALEAAHAADILHRDVKPANVLCTEEGVVVLVDFGFAREFPRRGATDRGASPYASPEQLRSEPLDALSDVYSLGATYYALLTGEPPPVDARPDPRAVAPEVPEACARIVSRAMAKDPAERYRSARELRADLEGALRPAAGIDTARLFAVPAAPSAREPDATPVPSSRVDAAPSSQARVEVPPSPESTSTTARPPAKMDAPPSPDLAARPRARVDPWKLVTFVLTVALAVLFVALMLGRG